MQHAPWIVSSSAHLWSPPIVTHLCPAATALLTVSANTWLAKPTDRGYRIRLLYSSSLGTWVKFRSPKSYTWHPGNTAAEEESELLQHPGKCSKYGPLSKSVGHVGRYSWKGMDSFDDLHVLANSPVPTLQIRTLKRVLFLSLVMRYNHHRKRGWGSLNYFLAILTWKSTVCIAIFLPN